MFTDFILSPGFTAFATVAGLLGDIAAVSLAGYGLYLTAFSKKLHYVSISRHMSKFFGSVLALSLQNGTLHAISIQSVFLMTKCGENFYYTSFATFSEPIIIESWGVKRIETKPFTCMGSLRDHNWQSNINEIIKGSVIGVKTGNDLLWIKQNKEAPIKEAKKAYKEGRYQILSVHRREINNKVISQAVDCVINLKMKDINGQFILKCIFGITGWNGNGVLLSEAICGYNALAGAGNTSESISKSIQTQLGITKENIYVEMIGELGF
ncbi:MAG: hypothetical protein K6B15_05150 [Parasporobacterium sp.]|nr:hypothetical protein [Parasporobacterium sp.]